MVDVVVSVSAIAMLVFYGISLLFTFCYSLVQMDLVRLYRKSKIQNQQPDYQISIEKPQTDFPLVTVQLPIFNELYVVERLLNAVAAFIYPREKLQIQVLDDSTDETEALIESKVSELRAKGLDISHIRRTYRDGFKAGALLNGLSQASGDFIAIFDADFLPSPDFLTRTIPCFKDERIGLVQTKWGHVNENYSLLTQLQAFGLDAHFTIEQQGRNTGRHFINFNGTAGVWRKSCIIDAGNWQSDTLTEDLDLSYRAQLKNWKFLYSEHVSSPAELPVTMNALKTQQFRWTKGAAECARKNLPSVLTSKHIRRSTKIHAFFHLMNCTVFVCVLLSALISIPLLFIKSNYPQFADVFLFASFAPLSLFLLSYFFWNSAGQKPDRTIFSFLTKFPLFLSVSMGFSLHNSIALFEGYSGKKIPFIRTPKFNITSNKDRWQEKRYSIQGVTWVSMLEGLLSLYFLSGIYFDFYFRNYGFLLFHSMLILGFGYVFYHSIAHSIITARYGNE
jgi:cellulose synthase/poly-beta-1,6-N-acetylglucosamine synthase-like glycosyltransferase